MSSDSGYLVYLRSCPALCSRVDKSSDFVIRSAGKIVHQIILESLGKPKQTSNTVLLTDLFEVTDPCCHATVVTKTTYSTKPA